MKRVRQKYECRVPTGFYGTKDLMEMFGKSDVTIWKIVKDGRLPKPFKNGKQNVWDKKTIQRWKENAKFTN